MISKKQCRSSAGGAFIAAGICAAIGITFWPGFIIGGVALIVAEL